MKKLRVDVGELTFVMEMYDNYDSTNFLDTETGEIVSVYKGLLMAIKRNGDKAAMDLPEWEKNVLDVAKRVYFNGNGRYQEIPRQEVFERHKLMVAFAKTVKNTQLREEIENVLSDKFAFRKFLKFLFDHPEELKRWFMFKEERLQENIAEWLQSINVEPLREQQER